jgi:hypothetical protein
MARQARDRGYSVQLVTGNSMGTEDFGLIAGSAAEGTLYTDPPDPLKRAEAAPVIEQFRASGFEPGGKTLYAYAAVQVWAQAAEKAGSLELQAMIAALRQHQFDTCWARSTSTRRATSLCKTRYGGSGAAARTCRWNKAATTANRDRASAQCAVAPLNEFSLRLLSANIGSDTTTCKHSEV